MEEPVLNFHFNVPVEVKAYRNPSSEPTKMVLLEITGEDFIASSVLNDQSKLSGGEILTGETPVSCAFPLNEGQFSPLANWAAAVREVDKKMRDRTKSRFIFVLILHMCYYQ